MATWSLQKAKDALDAFNLVGANREVADYWLSLWTAEGPPARERFDPRRAVKHVPAIAIFEVMPDGPIVCRLAGSYVEAVLGFNLTGKDLLALTTREERADRIRNARAIVDGAVSLAYRKFRRGEDDKETTAGELALPFAGVTEHGGRRYLFHSSWRPDWFGRLNTVRIPAGVGLAFDQRIVSICD